MFCGYAGITTYSGIARIPVMLPTHRRISDWVRALRLLLVKTNLNSDCCNGLPWSITTHWNHIASELVRKSDSGEIPVDIGYTRYGMQPYQKMPGSECLESALHRKGSGLHRHSWFAEVLLSISEGCAVQY